MKEDAKPCKPRRRNFQNGGSKCPTNWIEFPPIALQGCWGPASMLLIPGLCRTCPERHKEVFSWLEAAAAGAFPSLLS